MYLVVVGFFLAFFWPGSVVKNGIQRDVPSGQTWWLSSVLGNDWDVGWQGRARSPPPYIAILPPGSHWQWCNPSWSSPSWSWPTQVEGHHGQGGRFWFFGILVVLSLGCSGHRPLCRPMKVSRISKRPEIVVTFMGTLTVLHRPRVPDPGGARAGWGRAAFPHWFCMYPCVVPRAPRPPRFPMY